GAGLFGSRNTAKIFRQIARRDSAPFAAQNPHHSAPLSLDDLPYALSHDAFKERFKSLPLAPVFRPAIVGEHDA
ncbi:MAG: hypothetical protein ACJATP_003493, partial [Candidatus Azotimanducaceae bacterium]